MDHTPKLLAILTTSFWTFMLISQNGVCCGGGTGGKGTESTDMEVSTSEQYCSFFANRAPSRQPALKNCTWFKENSCCLQREIDATFNKVKPLQGASKNCQRYMNFLMCYICAPNQNLFYSGGQLSVCNDFCDKFYEACSSAILKGYVISELYSNGYAFCKSRQYRVGSYTDIRCFRYDKGYTVRGAAVGRRPSLYIVFTCIVFTMLLLLNDDSVSKRFPPFR